MNDPSELLEEIRKKLDEHGCNPRMYNSTSMRSSCPAHSGSNKSSLHVQVKGGNLLVHCHSGKCTYHGVLEALGLDHDESYSKCKVYDAVRYIYLDQDGKTIGAQVRYMNDGVKSFHQEVFDGNEWSRIGMPKEKRVPYRLPDLLKDASEGKRIWIVEGEKDVENLQICGIPSTCFCGGAGGWLDQYARWFRGTRVVLCGDRDEPGQKFVQQIRKALDGVADEVLIADLPYEIAQSGGKDVSDFLSVNSVKDLQAIVQAPWRSPGVVTMAEAAEEASNRKDVPMDHFNMVGIGPGYAIPGIGPGKLLGVVARFGTGKTAWIVDLAARALKAGKRVMFVSYDESYDEIASYIAASMDGDYTYCSWDTEIMSIRKKPNMCKSLMTCDGIIDGKIRSAKAVADIAFRHKPDILIVDHLAKIAGDNVGDAERIQIGKAARILKQIANEGRCAVVSAIQANREGSGMLINKTHIAGADEIGRECDIMIGINHVATADSEIKSIRPEVLLERYGRQMNELFPYPIGGDLGLRICPAIRVVNTVKSRMSRDDSYWPVIFYGAERKMYPVHKRGCQCKMCSERVLTQSKHDYILKMCAGGK